MRPEISIIIPTLNEEKYLPRLLDSIKRQNVKDYEIILSDGNSKDKTVHIAKRYGCRVVISKKRSPAHQRNEGASIAKGEILLFLDADVDLPNEFIKKSIKEFKKKNLGIAGFYIKYDKNGFFYYFLSISTVLFTKIFQYFAPLGIGAGLMVKRSIHDSAGGFDESMYIAEDHDYCRRCSKLGIFRILNSIYLPYSARRFEKYGKIRTVFRCSYAGFHYVFLRNMRDDIVPYEFGEH